MSIDKTDVKVIVVCITVVLIFVTGFWRIPHNYTYGDLVRMKISKNIGMVVDYHCPSVIMTYGCTYDIRFHGVQITTATSLFGDKPIKVIPVSLVRRIKEFELEAVDE